MLENFAHTLLLRGYTVGLSAFVPFSSPTCDFPSFIDLSSNSSTLSACGTSSPRSCPRRAAEETDARQRRRHRRKQQQQQQQQQPPGPTAIPRTRRTRGRRQVFGTFSCFGNLFLIFWAILLGGDGVDGGGGEPLTESSSSSAKKQAVPSSSGGGGAAAKPRAKSSASSSSSSSTTSFSVAKKLDLVVGRNRQVTLPHLGNNLNHIFMACLFSFSEGKGEEGGRRWQWRRRQQHLDLLPQRLPEQPVGEAAVKSAGKSGAVTGKNEFLRQRRSHSAGKQRARGGISFLFVSGVFLRTTATSEKQNIREKKRRVRTRE